MIELNINTVSTADLDEISSALYVSSSIVIDAKSSTVPVANEATSSVVMTKTLYVSNASPSAGINDLIYRVINSSPSSYQLLYNDNDNGIIDPNDSNNTTGGNVLQAFVTAIIATTVGDTDVDASPDSIKCNILCY